MTSALVGAILYQGGWGDRGQGRKGVGERGPGVFEGWQGDGEVKAYPLPLHLLGQLIVMVGTKEGRLLRLSTVHGSRGQSQGPG